MNSTDQQDLLQALRDLAKARSDERAWTTVYRTMWPFVLGHTYRALRGQRDLAEDASQEVFYRLVRYCDFETMTTVDVFRAYVRSVCWNVSRDLLSQIIRRREELSSDEQSQMLSELVVTATTPQDIAETMEILNEQVLAKLDKEDQTLVKLLLDGNTLGEIAQNLGIDYSNAGVRVHRLRERLRNLLKAL
jgi:RNA polymerase sigma factor (sigma-70 family)